MLHQLNYYFQYGFISLSLLHSHINAGCIMQSAYHLGLVQSFPTLARWASGPNVAIHHNKLIHIFACLYSVYCVTHISTQLAYCANLMVMLSCIVIMKLFHQTIAVETSYLICATYAVSKTISSPYMYAQLFSVSMISNSIVCPIVKCIVFHFECCSSGS